jgi:hypothetical protein
MLRKEYYSHLSVYFALARECFLREAAMLPSKLSGQSQSDKFGIRCLHLHTVKHASFLLSRLHAWQGKNIYCSCASYGAGVPKLPLRNRKEGLADWKEHHWKSMIAYDLLLDFDAESPEDIPEAARQACEAADALSHFDRTVLFSGMGFQVVVKKLYHPEHGFMPMQGGGAFLQAARVARGLKKRLGLSCLDEGVYDSRRVRKVPWSIASYPEYDAVCIPVSREQLLGFRLEDTQVQKWLGSPALGGERTW